MANWYASRLTIHASAAELAEITEFIKGVYDPAWTDVSIEGNELSFRTPGVPNVDTIDLIAEAFPNAEFRYTYYETTCFSCVAIKYRRGKVVFETAGHHGPDPYEEEEVHPYVYYEEYGSHRLFYKINGVWTEQFKNTADH